MNEKLKLDTANGLHFLELRLIKQRAIITTHSEVKLQRQSLKLQPSSLLQLLELANLPKSKHKYLVEVFYSKLH